MKNKNEWKTTLVCLFCCYLSEILYILLNEKKIFSYELYFFVFVFSSNANPDVVFEAAPKMILFDRYSIGKVFESSFEVRNTSTVAHQFRAIPPKTQFFNLSLGLKPWLASLYSFKYQLTQSAN